MTPEDLSLSQKRHSVGKSKPIPWSYRDGPPKTTENGTSLSTGDLLDDLIKKASDIRFQMSEARKSNTND